MDKQELRKKFRQRRRQIFERRDEFLSLSAAAQHNLLRDRAWQDSLAVALYAAARGETDTGLLLEEAWARGKEVYLPRCEDAAGLMSLRRHCPGRDLIRSKLGIPEPGPDAPLLPDSRGVLLVTPGLAFDGQGYRLGQGGGYYDRLLAAWAGKTVGLAFACQIADALPRAEWDRPVQGLCTEAGLLWL